VSGGRGDYHDLRKPDAVIMDEAGYRYLWPNDREYQIGRTFEMNDRRRWSWASASPGRRSRPSRCSTRATRRRCITCRASARCCRSCWRSRRRASAPGSCARIEEHTRKSADQPGLKAVTRQEFIDLTIDYYLKRTGIPINFGITVLLGFIVGAAIAGQTFYLFTVENLKQFGALKATSRRRRWTPSRGRR
jgi:putative ABC transport system permease protein